MIAPLAVLGPFRDTGGGLNLADGPEADATPFDPAARYSWGSFDVAWRSIPSAFAGALGVPLDVFVFPRKESCTWLSARLGVDRAQPLTVRVAAAGQVRLMIDGIVAGRDEAVHQSALFDRLAARVEVLAGVHRIAAKVCSGALDDSGRVRLRVTDDAGQWPAGVRSLAGDGGGDAPSPTPPRPSVRKVGTPLSRPSTSSRGAPTLCWTRRSCERSGAPTICEARALRARSPPWSMGGWMRIGWRWPRGFRRVEPTAARA